MLSYDIIYDIIYIAYDFIYDIICFVQEVVVVLAPFPNNPNPVAEFDATRDFGSRLYEVNLWLWRYGRGQPRTMSIEEAEAARQPEDRVSEARVRAEETKKRRREAAAREAAERAAAAVILFPNHI